MKPRVKFCFEDSDNSQKIDFELCEVEQIDAIIEGLEEARAELEHQIEMEKQRKRDKRKRAKMRRKENKKGVMHLPIKLQNGDEFVVTCDDVVFNEDNCSVTYFLKGDVVMNIPISSMTANDPYLNYD